MKALELNKIRKSYFGYEEIARIRGISLASAKVTASRYVKQGILLRLKKNVYVLRQAWQTTDQEEKFRIANIVQVPSYISLTTALSYYGITTQIQRKFYESVALKRTKEVRVEGEVFLYTKINESLYFGFKKENGIFIAIPEKALVDAFYLMSYGRYSIDLSAVDSDKLDWKTLFRLGSTYPDRTRTLMEKNGYLKTTRDI
ncbi:MAG: hypothetical protein HKM93_09225 [Desulfobacteraceae bacterium]|nr:hypothetical protein [Desulfobacteraceae bacterium]